ncbi:hypothetical protein [Acinetobacter sp. YH12239]|uniref:hypothetical protein n=1 Tax=Acinetobacter sp. YH12239 TaxID=2601166 RepID=UPI0015D310F2|nr:hypothetical protein [Acinetobacter sp. YH12239]
MKKMSVFFLGLVVILLNNPVSADKYEQMIFEIDFENSPEFSKKISKMNQINLNKFMSIGDFKRNQMVKQYFESLKIKQNRPQRNFEENCENRMTFDDYRIEVAMRHGFSIKQAVNSSGFYLPFNLCKTW